MPMGEVARSKNILDNLQAVATIGAIIAGGSWTYLLFVQQRQRFPHLKLEHKITHVPLPEHRILLVLDVTHSNVGTIKVNFSTADIRIYGLKRRPDLSRNTIDLLNKGLPGDIEPTAMWALLAGEVDALEGLGGFQLIYTYYRNPAVKDRDAGWSLRSIYDPRKPSKGEP